MRPSSLLVAAVFVTLLSPLPALAAGADGAWDCKIEDGEAFGSLGLEGTTYIFANPRGQSGKGGIAYQEGADAPTFVILNGVLVSEAGTLGGWLDASIPSEPSLTLIDALGKRVLCQLRPQQQK
jgi:hypothetical protein